MDFGDDKRFWYGPGMPPLGSGGDTALNGIPCSPISGSHGQRQVGRLRRRHADGHGGQDRRAHGQRRLPLGKRDLVRLGPSISTTAWTTGGRPRGPACGPIPSGTSTKGSGTAMPPSRVGDPQGALDAHPGPALRGRGHGCRTRCTATTSTPSHPIRATRDARDGPFNQTRDAALFNTQSRDKTDHNWDLSWIARFAPDAMQTYELGARPEDPLAQPVRALHLVHLADGGLHEQLRRRRKRLCRQSGTGAGGGPHHQPHRRLARRQRGPLGPAGDPLLHGRAGLHRRGAMGLRRRTRPASCRWSDDFTVLKYVNQSARLYGVDLSAQALLARGTALGDFRAQLVASYTKGENDDTDDNLYNIMPLNATLGSHPAARALAEHHRG